jgi:hypothetical protein
VVDDVFHDRAVRQCLAVQILFAVATARS